jgi:hypothetical protein
MHGNISSPWGDVNTVDGWWAYVSAQIYHGYLFGGLSDALPQKVVVLLETTIRQLTPIGVTIVVVGWVALWRTQRGFALVSVITVGAIGFFALVYNTVDSIVYLIFAMPLIALWLAVGLSRIARWLRERWRFASALIFLLPLFQLLFFWSEMDLHHDRTAMNWAERILSAAPPRAILRTAEDQYTFTLWYAHDVLGERPDVVVVDRDLWGFESYRKMMAGELRNDLSLAAIARETQRPLIDAGANP